MEESLEEWHMGKAFLFRVDNLLTLCTISQMKDDFLTYYKALFRLYIESFSKMNKEQKIESTNLLKEVTTIKNYGLQTKKRIPLTKFIEFELHLRNILEEKNLLTPKKETRGL